MIHETERHLLVIEDTEISFNSIYNEPYIPDEYRDNIQQANLLFIPTKHEHNGEIKLVFHDTIGGLLDYLNEHRKEGVLADAAISDEDFKVLELHSAVVHIPTFIVTSIILPIVINLLTSFLYDIVKSHHRNNDDMSAELNIIVDDGDNKSKRIEYKGPVSIIKETLDSVLPEIVSNKNDNK